MAAAIERQPDPAKVGDRINGWMGNCKENTVAYREALKVYTRDALPQDWAMTQNNLGNALGDQALASEGAERARLLRSSIGASKAALTIYTLEHFPWHQRSVTNNLARVRASYEGEGFDKGPGGVPFDDIPPTE